MFEISLSSARRRSRQSRPQLVAAQVETLEQKLLLSVTQTVTVVDMNTGRPLSGAHVAITDGRTCFAPLTTNSSGQIKIATGGGIQTILAYKSGYGLTTLTINRSATNYNVSLHPLASTVFTQKVSFIASQAWALAKSVASPQLIAKTTVGNLLNLGTVLSGHAAVGACVSNFFLPNPGSASACALSKTAFVGTTAAQSVYSSAIGIGMTRDVKVDVYWVPVLNQFFVWRAQ